MAFLAVDLDMPARLLDEAVNHAQPEAGSLADPLCREERLEDLVADCFRNAAAGVAHRDEHVVAGRNVGIGPGVALVQHDVIRLQRQLAAIRHGIAGIDGKVQKRGAELVWIDKSRPDIGLQTRLDLDMLAKRRAQQLS